MNINSKYTLHNVESTQTRRNGRTTNAADPSAGSRRLLWISAILTAMLAGFCKSIHTELKIRATPAEVWSVLMDNKKYPEWNPYHVRVEGELKEGNTIVVEVHKPNGNRIVLEPEVLRIRPERELTWGGGIPGLFTGEHVFEIVPCEEGVVLIHREKFSGIFVPFAELDSIEEGYAQMNQALKERVED
ncbi:MAG: SRPBCC domain-containing protein [Leptospiraceae bacterium]|nr:SRPBCC domain-containing protein [Leptospiraceae bacterium]